MVEATIIISISVRTLDDDGACNSILSHEELLENNVYQTKFISITGESKEECLMNLKNRLKNI